MTGCSLECPRLKGKGGVFKHVDLALTRTDGRDSPIHGPTFPVGNCFGLRTQWTEFCVDIPYLDH
jgi:hypothetical protein